VNKHAVNRNGDGQADWRVRWLVPLGMFAVSVLARTWRYRVVNPEIWQRVRETGKPWVFVLWHGGLLPLTYWHRGRDIAVLISEHRDGEVIARVVHSWGYRTVRGSTTRGGGRALLGLIRELQQGSVVAVTPDGPRGPAQTVQPGALVAAQRAGVPVIPIVVRVDRAWQLSTWDRFMVPKPFARITIAYGDATFVADGGPRGAADDAQRFEDLIRAAQLRADA
jgi:lysophospholipid acyltransferase (LPLAT)-like uncharacterized protein